MAEHCTTGVWAHVRKLIPSVILIGLAALAGGTDVFSNQVHRIVSKTLTQRLDAIAPYAVNVLLAAVAVNIFWLLYHPVTCGTERFLHRTSASDRAKSFIMKAVRLVYWVGVAFFVLSFFAQDLMAKLAVGTGLITAAVAFALQGLLNDFVSGLLLQSTNRVKEGDQVKVIGVDGADGTVTEIGYIQTLIDTPDGQVAVPNRTIWGNCTMRRKPKPEPEKPSLLILPDGFNRTGN